MRLIDVDALIQRIDKGVGETGIGLEPVMAIRDIKELISTMPTVDAEPVVRCENCESWDNSEDGRYCDGWCFCKIIQSSTPPDWYCAYGKGAYRGDKN